MKTKLNKLSDSRIEIVVTLDEKDLKGADEKALEKLAKDVRVEGFRKGKVPAEVARKFVPENELNSEAANIAVRETIVKAFQENDKVPLSTPNVNVTKHVPNEMMEYTATADIIPEIKLGDYALYPGVNTNGSRKDSSMNDIINNPAFIRRVMFLLNYSDGTKPLSYIARRLGCSCSDLQGVADILEEKGLIQIIK